MKRIISPHTRSHIGLQRSILNTQWNRTNTVSRWVGEGRETARVPLPPLPTSGQNASCRLKVAYAFWLFWIVCVCWLLSLQINGSGNRFRDEMRRIRSKVTEQSIRCRGADPKRFSSILKLVAAPSLLLLQQFENSLATKSPSRLSCLLDRQTIFYSEAVDPLIRFGDRKLLAKRTKNKLKAILKANKVFESLDEEYLWH